MYEDPDLIEYTYEPSDFNDAISVTGPTSAVNERVAVFDGTTGKVIKDGGKTISGILTDAQNTATGLVNGLSTTVQGLGTRLGTAESNITSILTGDGIIDDNAGSTQFHKTWSAGKIISELDSKPDSADVPGLLINDTATSGVNSTWSITKISQELAKKLNSAKAMVLKGTIGPSGATVSSLPAVHSIGESYLVIGQAATYAGQTCEVGDLIVCTIDGNSANDAHWTVVQNNIDPNAYALKANPVFTGSISLGRTGEAGDKSIAVGNNVLASGYCASAEGTSTKAYGDYSHVEGRSNVSYGTNSHVEGIGSVAYGDNQNVIGQYNIPSSAGNYPTWQANTEYKRGDFVKHTSTINNESVEKYYVCSVTTSNSGTFNASHWSECGLADHYVEIVGGGSSATNRLNLRALNANGDEYLYGDLYVQTSPSSSLGSKVATENYVNNKISDSSSDTTHTWSSNKISTEINNVASSLSTAMLLKGTIGGLNNQNATISRLPDSHTVGWTYRVVDADTYAGKECEVGDMIVCVNTGTTENNDDWVVIQGNVERGVIGPASSSSLNNTIALFDGNTGKLIKSSSTTISGLTSTLAPKNNPAFTGDITLNGELVPPVSAVQELVNDTKSNILSTVSSTYAPKASPSFTGNVTVAGKVTVGTAPTENMDVATKQYVDTTVDSIDLSPLAPKASPVFTGSISMGRKSGSTVGTNSVATGSSVEAIGSYSHAEGYQTKAIASSDHAEGYLTTAAGNLMGNAHAEGWDTAAYNAGTHSEGISTVAQGMASHAQGSNTTALSQSSTVAGKYNQICGTDIQTWRANTYYAAGVIVKNSNTVYRCKSPHTSGSTFALSEGNTSLWETYTVNNKDYAEIIGNGTSDSARSNARALDWDGNEYLKGDLYVGANANSTGGSKVATESYVTTAISPLAPIASPTFTGNVNVGGKITVGSGPTADMDVATKRYVDRSASLIVEFGSLGPNSGMDQWYDAPGLTENHKAVFVTCTNSSNVVRPFRFICSTDKIYINGELSGSTNVYVTCVYCPRHINATPMEEVEEEVAESP